jgi:hypothetical protein
MLCFINDYRVDVLQRHDDFHGGVPMNGIILDFLVEENSNSGMLTVRDCFFGTVKDWDHQSFFLSLVRLLPIR